VTERIVRAIDGDMAILYQSERNNPVPRAICGEKLRTTLRSDAFHHNPALVKRGVL